MLGNRVKSALTKLPSKWDLINVIPYRISEKRSICNLYLRRFYGVWRNWVPVLRHKWINIPCAGEFFQCSFHHFTLLGGPCPIRIYRKSMNSLLGEFCCEVSFSSWEGGTFELIFGKRGFKRVILDNVLPRNIISRSKIMRIDGNWIARVRIIAERHNSSWAYLFEGFKILRRSIKCSGIGSVMIISQQHYKLPHTIEAKPNRLLFPLLVLLGLRAMPTKRKWRVTNSANTLPLICRELWIYQEYT